MALTQKEKDELLAKSVKSTRSKFSKVKEFLTRKRKPSKKKVTKAEADVEKELPRGTPAPEAMEDYKPETKKSKPETKKSSGPLEISDFGKAFRKARTENKRLNGVDEFLFGGKQYSTVTKEDLERAGGISLREYLNRKRREKEKQNSDQE